MYGFTALKKEKLSSIQITSANPTLSCLPFNNQNSSRCYLYFLYKFPKLIQCYFFLQYTNNLAVIQTINAYILHNMDTFQLLCLTSWQHLTLLESFLHEPLSPCLLRYDSLLVCLLPLWPLIFFWRFLLFCLHFKYWWPSRLSSWFFFHLTIKNLLS